MEKHIKFPVFTVSKEGIAYSIESQERLESCTLLALQKNYYDNLIIYDSSLSKFQILDAKRDKTIWSFPNIIFLNPFIIVQLNISEQSRKYEIVELKKILIDNINRENSYWENIGLKSSILKKIRNATSFLELYNFYKQ